MASIDRLIDIAGGPDAVDTVMDVGANDGADSLPIARRFPNIRVIAVEPTPELARQLLDKSTSLDNYTVVPCAIGRADGAGLLTLRRESVHNSLEPIIESNVARVGIPLETYAVRDRVPVPVRTLDSLCRELDIRAIDVLHVDAQGSDFDVLVSAGERLRTVRAGVVEAGRRLDLYSNTVNRRQVIRFLIQSGFRIVTVSSNDGGNWEQNIFFSYAPHGQLRTVRAVVRMAQADLLHVVRLMQGGMSRLRVRLALHTRLRSFARRG